MHTSPCKHNPPTANAGPDQAHADYNDDGTVTIVLDGSASTDPEGDIVSWEWAWSGGSASGEITEGTFPATDLPETITLTVTDALSNEDTDTVDVTIYTLSSGLFYDVDLSTAVTVTTAQGAVLLNPNASGDNTLISKDGNTWSQELVTGSDTSRALMVQSDLLLIDNLTSPVQFEYDGSNWNSNAITVAPALSTYGSFTSLEQVSTDGATLVFEEDSSDIYTSNGGRVVVYDWVGTQWNYLSELSPQGGHIADGRWGEKVIVEGDLMGVSSRNANGHYEFEVFRKSGGVWNYEYTIQDGDTPGQSDILYNRIDLGGGVFVVLQDGFSGFMVVEHDGVEWEKTPIGFTDVFDVFIDDDGQTIAAYRSGVLKIYQKTNPAANWADTTIEEYELNESDFTSYSLVGISGGLVSIDGTNGDDRVRIFDVSTATLGINAEPLADAGTNIITTSFDGSAVTVFLNGGGSENLDSGEVVSAVWNWDGGSVTGLQTFAEIPPTIEAITLTLTDEAGAISRDTISVDIEKPPTISSPSSINVIDTDGNGSVTMQVSGQLIESDYPVTGWSWRWPGGFATGQDSAITLDTRADNQHIILEAIDSNGLQGSSITRFYFYQDLVTPEILYPVDGNNLGFYGERVSTNGDYTLIGASAQGETGAAYLTQYINGSWPQQSIIPSGLQSGYDFGAAIAVSEDYLFISAPYSFNSDSSRGAVYVYKRSGLDWSLSQELFLTGSGDGRSMAVDGNTLVVSGNEEILIYELDDEVWELVQLIASPNAALTTGFIENIAISGDLIAAGNTKYNGEPFSGCVEVYRRTSGTWVYEDILVSSLDGPSGSTYDSFANGNGSIAIVGDEILVGAYRDAELWEGVPTGAVYRFTYDTDWSFAEKIFPDATTAKSFGEFGISLSYSNDILAVGAPGENSANKTGGVSIYHRSGSDWLSADYLSVDPASVAGANTSEDFGSSVALVDGVLVVGAERGYDDEGNQTGRTYIFRKQTSLNLAANYEPIADAGSDIVTTDTVVRDGVSNEITEPLDSESVTLDGSASTDAENAMVSWDWTWDGGNASGETAQARFPVGTTTVTLTVVDAAGIINTDTVDVTVNLAQTAPDAVPSTTGNTLTINLPNNDSVWRLTSEFEWHATGEFAEDVVDGEVYRVEILPYPGATEAIRTQVIPQAGATTVNLSLLLPVRATETGTIRFPETAQGFSWRLVGENMWRDVTDNEDTFEDLIPATLPIGQYIIEYKPVSGYATPNATLINIAQSTTIDLDWSVYQRINNFDASKTFNVSSAALDDDPFQYIGMIRTPLGRGTGTVVADRVVLTAAHLFFDFNGLAWSNVQWFGRHVQDERQAPPQTPRGILYRASYAKLVAPDFIEGTVADLPEDDQEVDFAVLFFGDATWTQGSANFLQSTAEQNWLTGTEAKQVAGYPQRSQATADKGKWFDRSFSSALTAVDSNAFPLLYQTSEVFGDGGASGSSLFVQPAGTSSAYPAAILLAGQNRAVFRIIDSDVTRMIQDGSDAATGNDDVLDGSTNLTSNGSIGGSFILISVAITPPEAAALATWNIEPNAGVAYADIEADDARSWISDWDSYTITFNAVNGYATPDPITVVGPLANSTQYNATYEALSGFDSFRIDNALPDEGADDDGDFIPAIFEYAFDGNPDVADTIRPLKMKDNPSQTDYAEYEVYISADADAIRYTVVAADSLADLASGQNLDVLAVLTKNDVGASGYVTVTDTKTRNSAPSRYVYIIVEHDRSIGDNAAL